MDPTSPPLKRSLFGYRRDDVAQLLEDREAALRAAQERAASAGARLGDLDTELRSLRERLEGRDRDLEAQKREIEERSRELEERNREIEERDRELADARRRLEESDARTAELEAEAVTLRERGEAAESIAREFDGIVDAAEAAAASVLERIRQSVHEELAEVQREHQRASEENARIDRWREGLDETLRSLDARLASARADAEDAPRILSEALAPLHRSLADAGAEVSAVRDALAARDEATASAQSGTLPDVAEGPSLEEAVSVHEEEADIVISTDQPEDASDDASHNAGWSSRA
jgi:chromosome segregation ATPase